MYYESSTPPPPWNNNPQGTLAGGPVYKNGGVRNTICWKYQYKHWVSMDIEISGDCNSILTTYTEVIIREISTQEDQKRGTCVGWYVQTGLLHPGETTYWV